MEVSCGTALDRACQIAVETEDTDQINRKLLNNVTPIAGSGSDYAADDAGDVIAAFNEELQ